MIDKSSVIVRALESNQELLILLENEPRIFQLVVPSDQSEKFPRITFFELTNFDNSFADDTAISSEIHIQIDVWSKENPKNLAKEVDKTMKNLSFQRYSSFSDYEEDTEIYHKAMRYKTISLLEDE